MPAVELDRQAIERRDFPIGRRGYDPATVDAHLRALAGEFDELQRAASTGGADLSMASAAGSQVQSILAAAETAAAEIERQALDAARKVREAADRDAGKTREEAVEKARAHVAAVAQVTASLLERVGSMDGEVSALVESVRAGAGRLAGDLAAVETGMGELYDASAGRSMPQDAPAGSSENERRDQSTSAPPPPAAVVQPAPAAVTPPAPAAMTSPAAAVPAEEPQQPVVAADLDGARLIALNMALNGEPREDTERYLADNFQLPDRVKLVDEVYAAIEG